MHRKLLKHAVGINQKRSSHRKSRLFVQHPVIACDVLGEIRQQGVTRCLEALPKLTALDPGFVAEPAVSGAADDLRSEFLEIAQLLLEPRDFGASHRREIQGVKK